MNQQTLILDLDDTLIHCSKYFKKAEKEFVKRIKEWFRGIPVEEIKEKQQEFDLNSVRNYGLDSSRYPEALVATYIYFCKKYRKGLKTNEIEQIREIGQRVFEMEVEPFPNMYEVLNHLKGDGHQLYLFTGGDIKNQSRKIAQLDLDHYFKDGIFIFEHKNTKALGKVMEKINPQKESTWLIGNSLRTDIKPAIELGINAVFIPAEIEWSYNIVDIEIKPKGTLAELPSLLELPGFLREHAFFNVAK